MGLEDFESPEDCANGVSSPSPTPRTPRNDSEAASDFLARGTPLTPRMPSGSGRDSSFGEGHEATLERFLNVMASHLDARLHEYYLKHQHWLQHELPLFLATAHVPPPDSLQPAPNSPSKVLHDLLGQHGPEADIVEMAPGAEGVLNDPANMDAPESKRFNLSRKLMKLMDEKKATLHRTIGVFELTRAAKFEMLLTHGCFRTLFSLLLIAYALFVGIRIESECQHADSKDRNFQFLFVEMAFSFCFLFELAFRVLVQQESFIRYPWNLYDANLVILQFVDFMFLVFTLGISANNNKHTSVSALRQTLRVFRVARVLRLLRFVPGLQNMAHLICSTMWSVKSVLLATALGFYAITMILTSLVSEYLRAGGASPDDELTLREYFGNLSATSYTLLLSITNGVNWKEYSDALATMHPIAAALYLAFIVVSVVSLFNVITGVVVDQVFQRRATDRELLASQQKREIESVCLQILEAMQAVREENGSNVCLDELLNAADDAHFSKILNKIQLQSVDTRKIFHALDQDKRGEIDAHGFIEACMKLHSGRHDADLKLMLFEIQLENKRLNKEVRQELRDVIVRVNRHLELVLSHPSRSFLDPVAHGNMRQEDCSFYVSPFSPRASMDCTAVPFDTHDVPRVRPVSPRPTTPR